MCQKCDQDVGRRFKIQTATIFPNEVAISFISGPGRPAGLNCHQPAQNTAYFGTLRTGNPSSLRLVRFNFRKFLPQKEGKCCQQTSIFLWI